MEVSGGRRVRATIGAARSPMAKLGVPLVRLRFGSPQSVGEGNNGVTFAGFSGEPGAVSVCASSKTSNQTQQKQEKIHYEKKAMV